MHSACSCSGNLSVVPTQATPNMHKTGKPRIGKKHEANTRKSLKHFGISHWWILAAHCEINTTYLKFKPGHHGRFLNKMSVIKETMWLCLHSLFLWVRKKKQQISLILLICLNDILSTRYSSHTLGRVGTVMCFASCVCLLVCVMSV